MGKRKSHDEVQAKADDGSTGNSPLAEIVDKKMLPVGSPEPKGEDTTDWTAKGLLCGRIICETLGKAESTARNLLLEAAEAINGHEEHMEYWLVGLGMAYPEKSRKVRKSEAKQVLLAWTVKNKKRILPVLDAGGKPTFKDGLAVTKEVVKDGSAWLKDEQDFTRFISLAREVKGSDKTPKPRKSSSDKKIGAVAEEIKKMTSQQAAATIANAAAQVDAGANKQESLRFLLVQMSGMCLRLSHYQDEKVKRVAEEIGLKLQDLIATDQIVSTQQGERPSEPEAIEQPEAPKPAEAIAA